MKKLLGIIVIALLLIGCSDNKNDNNNHNYTESVDEVVYECISNDKTYDTYVEEYMVIKGNEEKDEIETYSTMINYHYRVEVSDQANADYLAGNQARFNDLKGVTYEANLSPYLSQERLTYDYTIAGFEELYEQGLVSSGNDQAPAYISLQDTLNLFSSMECQKVIDDNFKLKDKLLASVDMDMKATQLNEDLFDSNEIELQKLRDSGNVTKMTCILDADGEYKEHLVTYEEDQLVLLHRKEIESSPMSAQFSSIDYTNAGQDTQNRVKDAKGINFEYDVDETTKTFTTISTIDYVEADYAKLVELGLILPLANGQPPAYIMMQSVFESYNGWECTPNE